MQMRNVDELNPGMILGEPVLNNDGTIDLLARGTELTTRHIALLKRLSIERVKIAEAIDLPGLSETPDIHEQIDTFEKRIQSEGGTIDLSVFKEDLRRIETEDFDYIVRSSVNENLKISVLTGEGNIPLDRKHKVTLEETKNVFSQIREEQRLDIDMVRKNVRDLLPDMVRNNDVLMRLKQLEESDDYTFQHSVRVSMLASMIGKWLGYSKTELHNICEAGLLFDIGKMKVPDFLLNKETRLDEQEFDMVKKHTQLGYTVLLRTQGVSQDVKFAALQHHERMDGSGYPLRLRSGQIHEFAKIIMVCDIYDAMISDRNYRPKLSPFEAAEYISWNSGSTLDSRICYIFLSNLAEFYTGKACTLNTGEAGVVAFVDVNYPTRPVVRVGNRFVDLSKERNIQISDIS